MAGTVTLEQLEKLNSVIGHKATSLAAAVIRLHSADNAEKKWVYAGLCGALCFVIDRSLGGTAVFKMFDLNTFNILFEAELYFEFENYYQELNDNFYCFPIPGDHFIGLSFADSEEAMLFKSLVLKYSPKTKTYERESRLLRQTLATDTGPKKEGGFLSRLFGGGKKKQKAVEEEDGIDSLKISRPENAVHENHIGWDAKNQCFDWSQLSKELKRVFKKAGVRKKDLEDTNTALLIADAILNQPVPDAKKTKIKPIEKSLTKRDTKLMDDSFGDNGPRRSSSGRKTSLFSSSLKALQAPQSGSNSLNSSIEKKHFSMSKQDELSLTSKLASAIAQRRKQLTKHDVESEDDWSEEDS